MIKTNSPAIAGIKYVSATEVAVVAVGVVVVAVLLAWIMVDAEDG